MEPSERTLPVEPETTDLQAFIRQHRAEILAEWEAEALRTGMHRDLSMQALTERLPLLLEGVAQAIDELARGKEPKLTRANAARHAVERLREGFELGDVVNELSLLRDCTLRVWERVSMPRQLRGTL